MEIKIHTIKDFKIAEIISDTIIINSIEDGVDLMGNIYYQDTDKIILHEKNITPDFFDLKTGIAGEILQKFSTYSIRLVIVGDFSKYSNRSLQDFVIESNKGKQVNFLNTLEDAFKALSNKYIAV